MTTYYRDRRDGQVLKLARKKLWCVTASGGQWAGTHNPGELFSEDREFIKDFVKTCQRLRPVTGQRYELMARLGGNT